MVGFMQRPSIKELNRKIKIGKNIVAQGNIFLINIDAIAADAVELGYQVSNLKYCLKNDNFYLVSLHKNSPKDA